jgi:hypothetical protein
MTLSERHEEYMTRRIREEDAKYGVNVEYNNMRLTKELLEIKEDIKKLQIDLAYMIKKYEN